MNRFDIEKGQSLISRMFSMDKIKENLNIVLKQDTTLPMQVSFWIGKQDLDLIRDFRQLTINRYTELHKELEAL